jgi:hypothetical protein
MKKLLIIVLILGIGGFSGLAFGQEAKAKEKDRKGGFAVGGYDNTRQEKDKAVTKRSVELPDDDQQAEKAMEVEKVPAAAPAQAPAPQASEAKPQNEDKGKATGQASSKDAKSKQKVKKGKSK